jgi:phosphoenolpyruvate carboxykinase (ATP)
MRRIESFGSRVFLVNTGWYGGSGVKGVDGKSVGQRFSIAKTRTIISAIQAGELDDIKTESLDILNLSIPLQVTGIESSVLNPRDSWEDKMAYDVEAKKLAELFVKNMQRFSISDAIKSAGPKV